VVDDDPRLRPLLVDTLDAIGYESVPAADGVEALRILRREGQFGFDLLLSDIKMPNMDGLALLKRVRRLYPELPVLFITGVATRESVAAASPDGFLSKPFRIARLEELIENTLAARHSDWRPTPRPKVLIKVDEPDLRKSIAEALSFTNYLPFVVEDDDEAMQELERGSFDVMITEIEKSDRRPAKALSLLQKRHPSLPMVLTSSSLDSEDLGGLRNRVKIDAFVRNPFSMGELLQVLDKAVMPGPDHPA
jgi:DNA-binding NtrC family response regulator